MYAIYRLRVAETWKNVMKVARHNTFYFAKHQKATDFTLTIKDILLELTNWQQSCEAV